MTKRRQKRAGVNWRTAFCSPVLVGEDLLAVFALVDGVVAVLALLLEVLPQRVKDGARAGAGVLLVPPQLQRGGEELVAVFTAVHLFVCEHNKNGNGRFGARVPMEMEKKRQPLTSESQSISIDTFDC